MPRFTPGNTVCIDYAQAWQPAEQEAHTPAARQPAPPDWMAGVVLEARPAGEYLVQVHANLSVVVAAGQIRPRAPDQACS
jgi:hypothetical protein